ncbi:hypothetical protein WH47_03675 [Habropoda laboriosa]|uniref:Uncharacterized protein n=1 Tax=Habropoda laboriosa TaxID=597456 RepID=A0A0L7RIM5_9HYME|nr:hypothetical protein WH47_03674 [Habropoda laboriosa]KOC70659.1 hypothetical protein WH47_03675 [Habropoda laboriosa]
MCLSSVLCFDLKLHDDNASAHSAILMKEFLNSIFEIQSSETRVLKHILKCVYQKCHDR